jgi:hypothetical protein
MLDVVFARLERFVAKLAADVFWSVRIVEMTMAFSRKEDFASVTKLPDSSNTVRMVFVGVNGVSFPIVEARGTELTDQLLGTCLVVFP